MRSDPALRQRHRDPRTDQDLGHPSRRCPIRGIPSPHDRDHRRGDGEDDRQCSDDRRQAPSTSTRQRRQAPEAHRPHPVELLLDGERPVVIERRDDARVAALQVGVALAGGQLHPVGHLEQSAERVATQVVDAGPHVERSQNAHDRQAQQACRHQSSQPPGVERLGCDAAADVELRSNSDVIRNPDKVKKIDTPK